jgi:hypothetical protein
MLQGTIETWMLLEYADRGSLEQAIQARRFYKRTDATLDLVSRAAEPAARALTLTEPLTPPTTGPHAAGGANSRGGPCIMWGTGH